MCCTQLVFANAGSAQVPAGPRTGDWTQSAEDPRTRGEREYIPRPPLRLRRPSTCRPELQASIRVSGTVYNARHPERSLAILGPPHSKKAGLYRCGARWGFLRLLEVRPRAVLIGTESDAPCWVPISRPPPPPRPSAAAAHRSRPRYSRSAFTSEELEQSIQRVQRGVYRVDRTLLERALARAGRIARTTRARVVQAHGSPVGLALRRIPAHGLFAQLGLKRGDVLKTVNGYQIASVDELLSARTKLASASRLSLSLVRGGTPMTLEYHVH